MKLLPWDENAPPEKLYGPLGTPGLEREKYMKWRIPDHLEILC